MQITSPRWVSRWSLSAAGWAAVRDQFAAQLYPHGLPTSGADTVEANYDGLDLPTGCASMTRYTIESPGQRPGGDPQYTYLLYPSATPRGELLVWLAGHVGWSGYLLADEGYTLQAVLAAGYHVLVCDMPGFAYQSNPVVNHVVTGGTWSYADGAWSCAGGTLTEYAVNAAHSFAFDSDGGPLAMLQYVHHVICSTTSAVAECSPSRTALAGHSGGGVAACYVGAIDSRFDTICVNVPGLPYAQTRSVGSPIDYEVYWVGEAWRGLVRDTWDALRLAAAVPGRRLDLVSATNDEYWTISDLPRWYEDVEALADHVLPCGSDVSCLLDPQPYPGHNMHETRIARMLAILAEA
jgi:hypothetical protein